MTNRLLSGAIMKYLHERGELLPVRVVDDSILEEPLLTCLYHQAQIVLMEVTTATQFSLQKRLDIAHQLRTQLPMCKIVLLVDEKSEPDMAEAVKDAKKNNAIDGFFYSSVSGEYLAAMLDAL